MYNFENPSITFNNRRHKNSNGANIFDSFDQLSHQTTNGRSSVESHGKKLFSRNSPDPSIVLLWAMSHDPAIFGAPVAMNQPSSGGKHPIRFRCSVHRSPFEPTKRTYERSHFYRQHHRDLM